MFWFFGKKKKTEKDGKAAQGSNDLETGDGVPSAEFQAFIAGASAHGKADPGIPADGRSKRRARQPDGDSPQPIDGGDGNHGGEGNHDAKGSSHHHSCGAGHHSSGGGSHHSCAGLGGGGGHSGGGHSCGGHGGGGHG